MRHVIKFAKTCELSPDGSCVFVATNHCYVGGGGVHGPSKLTDVNTGTCLRTFDDEGGRSGKFSPDGTQIVVACENGTAKIYCLTEPPWSMLLEGHSGTVNSAAFSPCY
jgi:WD40 repeat protein